MKVTEFIKLQALAKRPQSVTEEYAAEVVLMLTPEDNDYGYMRGLIRTACGVGYNQN